ncbi:anti-sigma factor family protein [Paramagnetospirillum magneticum]|uniref:Predicted transmembrane transcriptional regulator n=1 Tax=Paramagnetospirillum magneticum (strain ATCC 700264 / AMB-1) TaxID=342108 RepID=Q2W3X6_PARM1|nr:anti-sigma factor [Paramagnetospirillum magneticum]BAE51449.1 Predicted transmembrane transcriptional regulator [Paramagnetospirillum magneticum AMB-1]
MSAPVSDDDLLSYVDGVLDSQRAAEVEAWLDAHPRDAERVRQWREQVDGLHRLFDPVLDEPLPDRLGVAAVRAGRPVSWLMPLLRVAAMVVLVLASGAAGWWLRGGAGGDGAAPGAQVASEALSAHVVFAAEIRHPVEVGAGERAHLVAWLSKRLGSELKVPDLTAAGFSLVGGRLLPASSGPAAQFMYENGAGRRVTLYLRRNTDGAETAFRFAAQGRVEAFYWLDGPLGYALAGDVDRDRLMEMAKAVYHQLES